MAEFLQVEPAATEADTDGRVTIDGHAMAHLNLSEGDFASVQSRDGTEIVARVGKPRPDDEDTHYVRINEHFRGQLGVSIGETVEVAPTDVTGLKSITLAPLSDVSGQDRDELAEYLSELLLRQGRTLSEEEIEYIRLPGTDQAAGFKIISSDPGLGVLTEETDVSVEYVFSTWGESGETTFYDIGGLDDELQSVRELIEFPLRFPDIYSQIGINPARGVILHGPPGTGKTMMARAISNELNANFHYINGPGIVSTGYGESEQKLREIFTQAEQSLPSIIFIDELDAIAPKREDTGSLADLRLVTQLLEVMDGLETVEGIMVVGTTNRIDSIEPALRRPGRFDRELYIGPPDRESREDILGIHTRGMLVDDDVPGYFPELAERTQGYTGADIMELTREAGISALRRQFGEDWESINRDDLSLADIEVGKTDFENALQTVQPSVLRGSMTSDQDVTWDDIGGLETVKKQLYELIRAPRDHPDSFDAMNLSSSPGILFTGPAGTGKSRVAAAAGNEFDLPFIQIDSTDVYSQWTGKSEQYIKQTFQIARRSAPSIMLVDNIDAIAGKRTEGGDSEVSNRVLSQLLTEMDRINRLDEEVTVIATTNRPDLLDDALLSANRFGTQIEFPLPDRADREDIFHVVLSDVEVDMSDEAFTTIATETDGWTGAQIEELARSAKLVALREREYDAATPVQLEHLETALEEFNTADSDT